jgi:hypothetical protein
MTSRDTDAGGNVTADYVRLGAGMCVSAMQSPYGVALRSEVVTLTTPRLTQAVSTFIWICEPRH